MSVPASWQRLKDVFFQRHPEAPNTLNEGAPNEELSRLKQHLPEVPEAVLQLLAINNGEEAVAYGAIMFGFRLLSIDDIPALQADWNLIAREQDDHTNELNRTVLPEGAGKADYFNSCYLVFADDGAGSSLVLDLAQGQQARRVRSPTWANSQETGTSSRRAWRPSSPCWPTCTSIHA